MSDFPVITKHLKISGHVQGVYFRESMCQKATEWNITGWVRNRHDGSVEAMVQGTGENLRHMLAWVQRGPEMAVVREVAMEDGGGSFTTFERRPTARDAGQHDNDEQT